MGFLSSPLVSMAIFLGLLIFIHELGHFLVGRLCGIAVEVFSIGFGPVILSFTFRKTQYRLSLIPLGGFVKFAGASPEEEVNQDIHGMKMHEASSLARFLTIFAGPFANFLLGIFVFSWIGYIGIEHVSPIIGQVLKGSVAEKSGLLSEDKIIAVDEKPIKTWDDFRSIISESADKSLIVSVERQNQKKELTVVPEKVIQKNLFGKDIEEGRIGIAPGLTPLIITVLDESTDIKTGDLLKAVIDKQGIKHNLNSWEEFQRLTPSLQEPTTLVLEHFDTKTEYSTSWPKAIGHSLLTFSKDQDGIMAYDRLIELQGQPIETLYDFLGFLEKNSEHETLEGKVLRHGVVTSVKIKRYEEEIQSLEGKKTIYLLKTEFLASLSYPPSFQERYTNPFSALWFGIKKTTQVISMVLSTTLGLLLGDVPVQVLGGPIMMAKVAQESMAKGLLTFFTSMAMVSINLGVMNLLPIPILDGGQILLLGWEVLTRRPPSERVLENFQKIGFIILLALLVLATYNDMSRFWASILKGVLG